MCWASRAVLLAAVAVPSEFIRSCTPDVGREREKTLLSDLRSDNYVGVKSLYYIGRFVIV